MSHDVKINRGPEGDCFERFAMTDIGGRAYTLISRGDAIGDFAEHSTIDRK